MGYHSSLALGHRLDKAIIVYFIVWPGIGAQICCSNSSQCKMSFTTAGLTGKHPSYCATIASSESCSVCVNCLVLFDPSSRACGCSLFLALNKEHARTSCMYTLLLKMATLFVFCGHKRFSRVYSSA